MPAETKAAVQLEIAHVLFIDIVGYSSLLISEQSELLVVLNNAVREAGESRSGEEDGHLVRLATEDVMAVVIRHRPELAARCTLETNQAIHDQLNDHVRMGMHNGP